MPSQQEVQWSQLKVGVLVIVALAALTALIFLMSGSTGGIFSRKITLRSYFENSAGLKGGAPVNLEGVTIGTVTDIKIVPARKLTPVEVTMKIRPGIETQYTRIRPPAWKPSAFWATPSWTSTARPPPVP